MVLHDSKEQFYSELTNKIDSNELRSEEFTVFIQSFSEPSESGFYELCSKFSDISLNAPKQADPVTCDVQACFQFSDCNVAKAAFKKFMTEHKLSDVEGLLDAVHQMHRLAVAWDDPRCKGGLITPKDYDWRPGFAGNYHNFCELPEDIWDQIVDDIKNEIK